MKIHVLFFAQARVLAGVSAAEFVVNTDDRLGALQLRVLGEYPALSAISGQLLWAVNGEYCDSARQLCENAEVACFPPVSGG